MTTPTADYFKRSDDEFAAGPSFTDPNHIDYFPVTLVKDRIITFTYFNLNALNLAEYTFSQGNEFKWSSDEEKLTLTVKLSEQTGGEEDHYDDDQRLEDFHETFDNPIEFEDDRDLHGIVSVRDEWVLTPQV